MSVISCINVKMNQNIIWIWLVHEDYYKYGMVPELG